jgi:hypothetical protein
VSKVTHLSETFYDEFATVAASLRRELSWGDYPKLYKFFKQKDLAGATHFLEVLHDNTDTSMNMFSLSMIRGASESWHEFYRTIKDKIDEWDRFDQAVLDWTCLMRDNGGSKRATELVRKRRKRLPAQGPVTITTTPVIKFTRL